MGTCESVKNPNEKIINANQKNNKYTSPSSLPKMGNYRLKNNNIKSPNLNARNKKKEEINGNENKNNEKNGNIENNIKVEFVENKENVENFENIENVNKTKRIGAQRKLSQKYCNDFRKKTSKSNNNYLVDHLVNSLNRNFEEEDIKKDPNKFKPEYLIDWKYIQNENTGIYNWKNCGKIPLTDDLFNSIVNLSLDEISKSDCLYKKRIWFANYIIEKITNSKNENPILVINRNNILEDSFNQFMTTKDLDLRKPIQIHFVNEIAHDAGGVYREWYTCLFKEFFNEKNKFFIENNNQCINKGNFYLFPKYDNMNLNYYIFFGKLSAKALIDRVNISELLNQIIVKYLRKEDITLEDMKYYDLSIYNSLKEIKNFENISSNKELKEIKFVWNLKDEKGNFFEVELIDNGKNTYLTNENKSLFIEKVIYYETLYRYEEQINKMREGFFSLFDEEIVKLFKPEEFNFQISGQKIIDIEDWKKNTIYKGHYNEDNQTIKYFWDVLSELSQSDLFIFFNFCTSSTHVPLDGFNSLKGVNNKIQKFTIEPKLNLSFNKDKDNEFKLIEAKTCFNRILLPEYNSKEEMKKCINIILGNDTQYFGLE